MLHSKFKQLSLAVLEKKTLIYILLSNPGVGPFLACELHLNRFGKGLLDNAT